METIFGYKRLAYAVKPIEQFVKTIDKEMKVAFKGEFLSDMGQKAVYVGLYNFIDEQDVDILHKWLYEQRGMDFQELEYNTFALLHEIGHVMSREKYDNLKRVIDNQRMDMENFRINHPYATLEEELRYYMEMKIEQDADNWANQYYNDNKDKVLKFQKKYIKRIYKIFDKVLD